MNNGWTPLHCAVEAGHKKISQLLLDSGGHPFASDRFNDTPFDIARVYKREEILEVLEKYVTPFCGRFWKFDYQHDT